MLKSLKELILKILDYVLPPRTNFDIVQKLSEKDIINLPKSEKVENFEWITPLFKYKDKKVRAIVWELKYKDNTSPLDTIGRLLFDEILILISDILIFNNDAEFVLIPIPITNIKRSVRGYNQSEYIAKSIIQNDIEHSLLYAPQWFQKIKETSSQSHSESKEERIQNLTDSFEANANLEGKYVILIDDVVTTGSTLLEARKTLLEAGARDVLAFTIAH